MHKFSGVCSIVFIINDCKYELSELILSKQSDKKCDNATRSRAKIKSVRMMYKFSGFFDALDCMQALRSQSVAPLECRLYAAEGRCYIMMKTVCSQRAAADRIALEFGQRVSRRAYPIIAERAELLSNDFYSDSAKIGG